MAHILYYRLCTIRVWAQQFMGYRHILYCIKNNINYFPLLRVFAGKAKFWASSCRQNGPSHFAPMLLYRSLVINPQSWIILSSVNFAVSLFLNVLFWSNFTGIQKLFLFNKGHFILWFLLFLILNPKMFPFSSYNIFWLAKNELSILLGNVMMWI